MLVAARLVQGAAAAVMMPSSMALVGQAFPDPVLRARAVALWAMGGAAASSTGPVTGGLLTLASWRLIFFINIPAAAVTLVLLARTAPSPRRRAPFDWAGQFTAVVAMGGGPLVMPPMTAVLLDSVPAHRAGTASGIFNTSRQVGGALAVAVFGSLLASRAGFLPGLRISLPLAAAALAAAAAGTRLTSAPNARKGS